MCVCRKGAAATGQQQNRSMATLKQIQMRLKSVTNIQKITQSMKMVSAAKYARAERELRQARPYGEGVKVNRNNNNKKKIIYKVSNYLLSRMALLISWF